METSLSKTISYFLRHAPEEGNLDMDEHGFVPVRQLVEVLRERKWTDLSVEKLSPQLSSHDAERFQLAGDRVRARYGHSVDIEYDLPQIKPETDLYHGTGRSAWPIIREEGLKPMGRSHVHLSRDPVSAREVGLRHDERPVILEIQPEEVGGKLLDAGPVILTSYVPPVALVHLNP